MIPTLAAQLGVPQTNWLIPIRIPMPWEHYKYQPAGTKTCTECGTKLTREQESKGGVVCSRKCAAARAHRLVPTQPALSHCKQCGKPNPNSNGGKPRQFCGTTCNQKYQKLKLREKRSQNAAVVQ